MCMHCESCLSKMSCCIPGLRKDGAAFIRAVKIRRFSMSHRATTLLTGCHHRLQRLQSNRHHCPRLAWQKRLPTQFYLPEKSEWDISIVYGKSHKKCVCILYIKYRKAIKWLHPWVGHNQPLVPYSIDTAYPYVKAQDSEYVHTLHPKIQYGWMQCSPVWKVYQQLPRAWLLSNQCHWWPILHRPHTNHGNDRPVGPCGYLIWELGPRVLCHPEKPHVSQGMKLSYKRPRTYCYWYTQTFFGSFS